MAAHVVGQDGILRLAPRQTQAVATQSPPPQLGRRKVPDTRADSPHFNRRRSKRSG